MIKAKKNRLFEAVFTIYNRWLFRRRFHNVHVKGLENLTSLSHSHPQIVCMNHSSWWDGLVAYLLSRHCGLDGYCMMEERQLAKLRPFTLIGAFSVVRESGREAYASFKYAVELLKDLPGRTLWIFPQGKILPNETRPLKFFRGFERIAHESSPVAVLPLAIRYEFRGSFKPEIFVSVGSPRLITTTERLSDAFESEVTQLLTEMRDSLATGEPDGYLPILRGLP